MEAMKNISRSHLAQRMKSSRRHIGRLLDSMDGNVTTDHAERAGLSVR
jgi:hypothetical protein